MVCAIIKIERGGIVIDYSNFRIWLIDSNKFAQRTVGNYVSRLRRANSIVEFEPNPIYIYYLEQNEKFICLSNDVKSQIKKAVKLYFKFLESQKSNNQERSNNMKILSLFANIGVAEAYLQRIGFDVVVANELVERRAALYQKIYPKTKMICGDITKKDTIDKLVSASVDGGVDIVMATPPCQGMSTAGQQKADDMRNTLILPVVEIIKGINPKYIFIENVPLFFSTAITVNNEKILITEYLKRELNNQYRINQYVIDTKDYSVPQTRERAIILLSRNDMPEWVLPEKSGKIVTMRDAIGKLPPLDPFVKDVDEAELLRMFPHFYERKEAARAISQWHTPTEHIKRQVVVMQHTPSGCTAFDNKVYYPTKENGEPVKGYHNTYKRQNWDTPAYTVTMDNRKISSQNNVHPGRLEYIDENGDEVYSDARTLTLYELMIISSIPDDWPIPSTTPPAFLRRIIGEGIPPLFVKRVFEKLKEVNENE